MIKCVYQFSFKLIILIEWKFIRKLIEFSLSSKTLEHVFTITWNDNLMTHIIWTF